MRLVTIAYRRQNIQINPNVRTSRESVIQLFKIQLFIKKHTTLQISIILGKCFRYTIFVTGNLALTAVAATSQPCAYHIWVVVIQIECFVGV